MGCEDEIDDGVGSLVDDRSPSLKHKKAPGACCQIPVPSSSTVHDGLRNPT